LWKNWKSRECAVTAIWITGNQKAALGILGFAVFTKQHHRKNRMIKQPEALRLADNLVNCVGGSTTFESALELRRLHEVNAELLGALKDAVEHLEYSGYGDSWERECAHASKLPVRLEAAISLAEPVKQEVIAKVPRVTGKERQKLLRRIKRAAIAKTTGETE
jgi:hypothetical protein